jgi:hypothetical protein
MVWARQYPRTKSHPHIVFPIPREIDSGAIPDHVTGAGSFEHVKDDFYASAIQVLPQQYDRDGPSQGLHMIIVPGAPAIIDVTIRGTRVNGVLSVTGTALRVA